MSTDERFSYLEQVFQANDCSVPSFLKDVFNFLGTRSDIYRSPKEGADAASYFSNENMIVKLFRECNPYVDFQHVNEDVENSDMRKHCGVFLPAAVAEEVEITSDDIESFSVDLECDEEGVIAQESQNDLNNTNPWNIQNVDPSKNLNFQSLNIQNVPNEPFVPPIDEQTPKDSTSTHDSSSSESYNGAVRENYSWSQNISELDVTIKVPEGIKSAKQLRVNTTADSISVDYLTEKSNWLPIVKDKLSYKIRPTETVWVMSEGRIRIHLEKHIEKWWNSLLESEPKLDTTTLNCTRPLHELPEDQIEKVREVQFNHMQKLAGKPTSDDIKQEQMLRRAWNAPGSPFLNTPFDPTILSRNQ